MNQGASFVDNQMKPVTAQQAAGVQFSVYAPRATAMNVCLISPDGEERSHPMKLASSGIWHRFEPGITEGQHYGFRAQGGWRPSQGLFFNPSKLLIDPYARQVDGELHWHPSVYGHNTGSGDLGQINSQDNKNHVPTSVVRDSYFDWDGVPRPETAIDKTLIYELHVKGFTWQFPGLPKHLRGTFLGLCHPTVIEYLTNLGITAIELLPITSFTTEHRLYNLELKNYWGYNPICFAAPHGAYACEDPVIELKTMVRELHRAGIEVVLDVVFNHNCESGADGPLLGLKGLAADEYFLWDRHDDTLESVNYTGCGNTLNFDSPHVQNMVVESLCRWSSEYHIDGFRFDLAPVLGRHGRTFSPDGPTLSAINKHPQLKRRKFIAEPWDLGPKGYHLGEFPSHWMEWNDRFRKGSREFWRGDVPGVVDLAWRMDSSRDIFSGRPYASINYLCSHDGFTLNDLVSYQKRDNRANGEDNRDGSKENISWNNGTEGDTSNPVILERRLRARRNLLATLLLSRGTPMLMAGDEFGNSQQGNNNGYCQDNPIAWLDWHWLKEKDSDNYQLAEFTRQMIALRYAWDINENNRQQFWYDNKGIGLNSASLLSVNQRCLQCSHVANDGQKRLYVLINNTESPQKFTIPPRNRAMLWHVILNTSLPNPMCHEVLMTRGWLQAPPQTVTGVIESPLTVQK